jgi:hypothetical protein
VPEGRKITESPAVPAAKENHTSRADEEVNPLHEAGARLWVALALE